MKQKLLRFPSGITAPKLTCYKPFIYVTRHVITLHNHHIHFILHHSYLIIFEEIILNEQIIRTKIKDFITRELIRDEDYDLQNDEKIITDGLMDSFSLAELGVYVEDEFDVYIPDSDLTIAKMDTLDLMVARVMRGLSEK